MFGHPLFFLKRHLFYVRYISGHVPNMVFLLSVNVRTQKIMPLISHKTFNFHYRNTLYICSCLHVFPVSVIDMSSMRPLKSIVG